MGKFVKRVGNDTLLQISGAIDGDGPYIIGVTTCGNEAFLDRSMPGNCAGANKMSFLSCMKSDDVSTSSDTSARSLSLHGASTLRTLR
jgi:hypothetical protein